MDSKKEESDFGSEDEDLWKAATRDVKRMPGSSDKKASLKSKSKTEASPREKPVRSAKLQKDKVLSTATARGYDLDKRTDQRLRRGEMKIEARIDLHGMTQADAHEALNKFILRAHVQGKRCVLVITGKGYKDHEGKKPGILKRAVPEWLRQKPLTEIVLRFYEAQRQHGGAGALYVLLRRQR